MGGEKLTPARCRVLVEIAALRPVAGNDEGWIVPNGARNQVAALRGAGLIERKGTGAMCGMDYHRITDAGRAALARHQKGNGGDGHGG